MAYRLTIFTLVLAVVAMLANYLPAQPEQSQPDARNAVTAANQGAMRDDPRGLQLVRESLGALGSYSSVAAKVRHESHLFDVDLVGTGSYLQGAPGSQQMRLDIKMRLTDGFSFLQHVSDGQYLWLHQQLQAKTTLKRVDLASVANRGSAQRSDDRALLSALPTGGLPTLLKNLQQAFHFTTVTPAQLDELPGFVVRGEWQPAFLARLLPEQQTAIDAGQPLDLSKLPAYKPDHVLIFIGRDDRFPYRIEYCRTVNGGDGETPNSQRLVALEFYDVLVDVEIAARNFRFEPGSLAFTDATGEYLESHP